MSRSSITAGGLGAAQREALDVLFQPFARSDAPGLVVGIARDGRPLYRRAFGLASVSMGVANTVTTRVRIGSSAKQFTCLAALLLAEDGLLDLDAGVRRYLPMLPELRGEPSLRQLMNHTGGYRCYLDLSFISDGLALKPAGSALAAQARQGDANFAPGEAQLYCNGGYHLLATVVEQVSGQALGELLRRRVFEPLDMRQTEVVAGDFGLVPGLATLHLAHGEGYCLGASTHEDVVGDGAMVSTADDMLLWLAHLRSPSKVGRPDSWAQLIEAPRPGGQESQYALGLMRTEYRGVELLHHAGRVIGGASQVLTVPSLRLDVVILGNTSACAPATLAKRVLDILGDFTRPVPAAPSSVDVPGLAGCRYAASDGLVIGFVEQAGALALTVFENGPLPLRAVQDGWLLAFEDSALGPLRVTPMDWRRGEVPARLEVTDGARRFTLERLPADPPAQPDIRGSYTAPDLLAAAVLTREDGELLLRIHGESGEVALDLRPLASDLLAWTSRDPLLPLRGVLRVTATGFEIFTPRTRGVLFHRAGPSARKETS